METAKKQNGIMATKRQPVIKNKNQLANEENIRPVAKDAEQKQSDIAMYRDVLGHLIASFVDAPQVIDKIRIARNIKSFESSMLYALNLRNGEMQKSLDNLTIKIERALRDYRLDNQGWKVSEEMVNGAFDDLLDIATAKELVSISTDMFSVTRARSDVGRNQGVLPMTNQES